MGRFLCKLSFICLVTGVRTNITLLTRKCKKCGCNKSVDEFVKNKNCQYGIEWICKYCQRLRHQQYRIDNKESLSVKSRQYYINNKENILQYQKQYAINHVEKLKIRDQKYRQDNKEIIQEHDKKYYQQNKEHVKHKAKLYYYNNHEEQKQKRREYTKNNKDKRNKRTRYLRQNDLVWTLRLNLSRGVRRAFQSIGKNKAYRPTLELLGFSKEQLGEHLLPYLNKLCERCQNIIITKDNLEIDHIIPTSLSKTEAEIIQLNQLKNLRLICSKCNLTKSDKLDFDNAILPEFADFYINRKIKN